MKKKIIKPLVIALLIVSFLYACGKQLPSNPTPQDTAKTPAEQLPSTPAPAKQLPSAPIPQDTAKVPVNVYSEDPYTFGNNILIELKKRGNDLTYSKNNYEDKQESNFVKKNGIYVSISASKRNNMFLVYGIPKTFTKEAYNKLKADYVDILDAEYDKFKNEYSRINMNIQDAPGNETTKNGFLFYNVPEKKLYLDKTDGI